MLKVQRLQRGMSLVEALVAFAVSAIGLVAIMGAQTALRQSSDLVRQKAEAVRLAQGEMEQLRAFASISAFDQLAQLPASAEGGLASNTHYSLHRELVPVAGTPALSAQVRVSWTDRQGHDVNVALASLIAGIDPALSGRLTSPSAGPVHSQPMGRASSIPVQATDFGNGRSGLVPPGTQGIAWVFDNASGEVTQVCSVPPGTPQGRLSDALLSQCVGTRALLVSGHVRFATESNVSAVDAEHPGSAALDLDMRVTLREGSSSASCTDDAGGHSGQTVVTFHCLVTPETAGGSWSGRLDVVPLGWTIGTDAANHRVCRYSADYDGRNGVSNDEHPLDYAGVRGALKQQNFLVIRGSNTCPTDVAADPLRGDVVNSNTVEQSPSPTPTSA